MEQIKLHRLMDLAEEIKKIDVMIQLHADNPSSFMLDQYKEKKQKLIGYLIDELIEPEVRSLKSFEIIRNLIVRFYPHIEEEAAIDQGHNELKELQAVLS